MGTPHRSGAGDVADRMKRWEQGKVSGGSSIRRKDVSDSCALIISTPINAHKLRVEN